VVGAFEYCSGYLHLIDFPGERGCKSRVKGCGEIGQLDASLVEKARTSPALGGTGNLATISEQVVPDGIGETGLGDFRR
jgi:hypothetical protein